MELLPLLFCCFLTLSGLTFGAESGSRVIVTEDGNALLSCSLNNMNIKPMLFDWRKDKDRLQVFMYDDGTLHNKGPPNQAEQFKGRVSHFPEELQHGNASIRIENTKVADSGNYTCEFPRIQPEKIFHIELIVEPILKDRTDEKIPGAAPKPIVRQLNQNGLLQCDVDGAFPKPTVEWMDSANQTLLSEEPVAAPKGDRFYITLKTTVSKSGLYRCVSTQKGIWHRSSTETFVNKEPEGASQGYSGWWVAAAVIFGLLFLCVVIVLFVRRYR
ncbi:butyrophilin subfamily 2 member A1 isoform X1 [Haplochromis burtoni]|uniref:butyrophilin subfamily 2 member A1 isoform X1 n=1 Tax=Haplochromis burtoni TaxID=8153 RepID=UPI0003BD382D|nr:butyrophilin subfamily 2 member A1 isoform X1 [Haplochromis burtoni]